MNPSYRVEQYETLLKACHRGQAAWTAVAAVACCQGPLEDCEAPLASRRHCPWQSHPSQLSSHPPQHTPTRPHLPVTASAQFSLGFLFIQAGGLELSTLGSMLMGTNRNEIGKGPHMKILQKVRKLN